MNLSAAGALLCGAAALLACGPARAGGGEQLGVWPEREGRVVLTQYSSVSAVALSERFAYLVTPQGIAVHDRLFDAWRPPIGTPGGLWVDQVALAATDPSGDGVWVARQGELAFHDVRHESVARAIVPGVASELVFDRRLPGSVYARIGGSWLRVSTAGVASPVAAAQLPGPRDAVRPRTPDEILQRYPGLRDFARLLTRDAEGRTWQVSSIAEAPERSEVWLGTIGGGAYRVDPFSMRSEPVPFGLLDRGAGAVVAVGGGVWIAGAGNGRPARGGLTFASADLQRWRWLTGPALDRLAAVPVHAMRVAGDVAWLGTDRGVARVDVRDEGSTRFATIVDGMPAERVYAIAARDGLEAWAGTSGGLVRVSAEPPDAARPVPPPRVAVGPPLLRGTPVRALVLAGGRLWIGSEAGLLVMDPDDESAPDRPAGSGAFAARLRRSVRALAAHEGTVAVVTESDILFVDVASGAVVDAPAGVSPVGRANAVALDATTLWIGEPGGVRVVDRQSGLVSRLAVRQALPDEALDIALAPGVAWIATREGVVRIRRRPDGSPW